MKQSPLMLWKADGFPAQANAEEPFARDVSAVLVRLLVVSICASDRRVLAGSKGSFLGARRLVLGHEGGGRVVDAGPYAAELPAGCKVVVLPHLTCGAADCPACRQGLTNLCPHMRHVGFHVNGVFADLMSFPRTCLLRVDDDFPDDALPLVEPLACVLRSLTHLHDALTRLAEEEGGTLSLFGAGPMGCLTAATVRRIWAGRLDPDGGPASHSPSDGGRVAAGGRGPARDPR